MMRMARGMKWSETSNLPGKNTKEITKTYCVRVLTSLIRVRVRVTSRVILPFPPPSLLLLIRVKFLAIPNTSLPVTRPSPASSKKKNGRHYCY